MSNILANEPRAIWSDQQQALANELVNKYGIELKDILFYDDDQKPFLMYEANSALCNHLANVSAIDVEPVQPVTADSVSVRCTLTLEDGRVRSAVGVTNQNEKISGRPLSDQQLYNLSASRALRNALKSAGIDLIKRHIAAMTGADVLDFKVSSNKDSLLKQAHALGAEKGLIIGSNKSAWYHVLWSRYEVTSSDKLSEDQLSNFVAYLRSYELPKETALAA